MASGTARSTWTWVGLRKVLTRYGHWRRLQDHVTMLSKAGGTPIGRAHSTTAWIPGVLEVKKVASDRCITEPLELPSTYR